MLVENTLSLVRVIVASEFVVVTLIALAGTGTFLVHFCLFYGFLRCVFLVIFTLLLHSLLFYFSGTIKKTNSK